MAGRLVSVQPALPSLLHTTHICSCVYLSVAMCVSVCMSVCVSVCLCVCAGVALAVTATKLEYICDVAHYTSINKGGNITVLL